MTSVLVRILGPEERSEKRLRHRVQTQLSSLRKMIDVAEIAGQEELEDALCEIVSELSFNLRRLLEVQKRQGSAKGAMVGWQKCRSDTSFWDFLGAACHLQSIHLLWANGPDSVPTVCVIGIHSDTRDIGIEVSNLFAKIEEILAEHMLPHYGEFPEQLTTTNVDERGVPIIQFMVTSRRNAVLQSECYWTSFNKMTGGFRGVEMSYEKLNAEHVARTARKASDAL